VPSPVGSAQRGRRNLRSKTQHTAPFHAASLILLTYRSESSIVKRPRAHKRVASRPQKRSPETWRGLVCRNQADRVETFHTVCKNSAPEGTQSVPALTPYCHAGRRFGLQEARVDTAIGPRRAGMTLAGILSAASTIAGARCPPMSKAGQVGHEVVSEPPVVSYKDLRFGGYAVPNRSQAIGKWFERHNFCIRYSERLFSPEKYICFVVTATSPVST
jgi:hypothetical protein